MNKNGELVTGPWQICDVICNFYETVYINDLESETVQDDFLKGLTVKLSQEGK